MKLEKFKFFSTSSLISWANTFEIQEFRPKIEIFHKHSKICPMSIMRSLHHTMKLENSIFFSTSSLISWANTFEIQEFRPKIEIFHKHSKICHMSIMRSLHHTMKLENSIFFQLRHSFHGLTPLKLKNFDQKLKYSINTKKIAQCL